MIENGITVESGVDEQGFATEGADDRDGRIKGGFLGSPVLRLDKRQTIEKTGVGSED